MANTTWFVLRGAMEDGSAGGTSPDIILGGPKPDPKYAEQYHTPFNTIGSPSGTNYVYVRAKNTDMAQAIGSVWIFAAPVDSLHNASQWTRLHTADGRESTNIWANPGSVGVNGAPLIWEPGKESSADVPWCLIAEIVGDGHSPLQIPASVADKASFDTWIATQPRMAYVIVQTPQVVPVEAPTFGWRRKVILGNAAATTLNVSLTCTQGTAGGYLAYSFDKNDSSGNPIGVGKTRYQLNRANSQSRTVPAQFSSSVSVTYTPAADDSADAEFAFQVSTETGDGGNGDGGDLGTSTTTVVASYTLRFGQTRGA